MALKMIYLACTNSVRFRYRYLDVTHFIQMYGTAKLILKNPSNSDMREVEEEDEDGISLWPPGLEYKKVVSWTKFYQYWKNNFPQIKIWKKGADTCTDCMILRNEFRSLSQVRRRAAAAAAAERKATNSNGDNGINEEQGSDMDISNIDSETEVEEINDNENNTEGREKQLQQQITVALLEKARAQVHAYQVQRDESKDIVSPAKLDITRLLPSLYHHRVLTLDMGQNLNLPNFESKQPGDMYYTSPLTVLLFGVVKNAPQRNINRGECGE